MRRTWNAIRGRNANICNGFDDYIHIPEDTEFCSREILIRTVEDMIRTSGGNQGNTNLQAPHP